MAGSMTDWYKLGKPSDASRVQACKLRKPQQRKDRHKAYWQKSVKTISAHFAKKAQTSNF